MGEKISRAVAIRLAREKRVELEGRLRAEVERDAAATACLDCAEKDARIAALEAENQRLKRERLEIEEIEANVCPEDVSFFEYINRLESELTAVRAKVANQAERIRTLEGATNHAGGLRDATPEVRTMDDLLWVPRCAESSEADAEYWGRMYAVEQERAERALAAFHRTEAALAAKTAECDLRGAQLLMIGSEISGDRKVNPADRGDPRWTPTLEQVAAIRAREADPGRVERAAEAIWSLCAPGRGNPMSWASVGAEYPTVADAFREKAKTVLAAADGEVLR